MTDFRKITGGGPGNGKGGGRYLCAAALLAFILSAGFFLSACGGGGSGDGNGNSAVTVSFGEASYSVTEGESVDVAVTLSTGPESDVTIPVTVDMTSTAADGDYQLPASVTFASGETTKNLTVAALEDNTDDDGETMILNFGTLPAGVSAGTTSSTTVTINDAPDPCADAVAVTGTEVYDVKTADNGEDSDPDGEGISICGDDMDNVIKGGSGDDTIRGGGGDDTLQGREGDDEIHGGPGTDTVIYRVTTEGDGSLLEALDISLADGTAASDGHGGTDTLSGIENVMCDGASRSAAGATIIGDDQDNILQGCRNIDNDDQLIGHGGDDTFLYSIGNEFFDGGPGTDTLDMSRYSSAITVDLSTYIGGVVADPGDFGRYVDIGGNAYAKLEEGSSVEEGEGQSTIENVTGGSGDDTLTGDSDDNTLAGGAGADTLAGGAGDDTYHADSSDTVTEAADAGDDTVYFTGTAGIAHGVTYGEFSATDAKLPPANVETIYGTEHDDKIRAPAGGVTVVGGAGADTLLGDTGADTLIGCGGRDILYSNVGISTSPNSAYAAPGGTSRDDKVNTFVIVSGDDGVDVIRGFQNKDRLVLAGFSPGTDRDDLEVDIDLTFREIPFPIDIDGNDDNWVKVSVNSTSFFMQGAFGASGGDGDVALKNLLENTNNQAVVFDPDYDTKCD